jgi:uncharacterized membrane protein YdjX (TVP38/TMEM64 family)
MSIEASKARPPSLRRALLLLPVPVAILLFFAFGLDRYVTATALAEHRQWLLDEVASLGLWAPLVFILIYALLVAASIPGAAFLTIAAGFVFGTGLGALYSLVGATLGATAIFLLARTAIGEGLRLRAGPFLHKLAAGFQRNALSYLLFLRLVPVFPFFIVNLVPAFLGVRLGTFIIGTLIGIIPGSLVYSGVGASLCRVTAAGGKADLEAMTRDPRLWLPFLGLALLSLAPVAYRRLRRAEPKA